MTMSIIIADEVIRQVNAKHERISGNQLHLILYYLDVISLLENGKHLITNEQFKKYSAGVFLAKVATIYKPSSKILANIKPYPYLVKLNGVYQVRTYYFSVNDVEVETRQFIQKHLTKLFNCDIAMLTNYAQKAPQFRNKPDSDNDTINYYQSLIRVCW